MGHTVMKASLSKSVPSCSLRGFNSKLLGQLQVRSSLTILTLRHFSYESSHVSVVEFFGSSAPVVFVVAGLH